METLSTIKNKTLYWIIGIVSVLIFSLIGISFLTIEQTMQVVVSVGHDTSYLRVDSASVYRIEDKSYITVNINNIYYKTSITSVIYDDDSQMFDVTIRGLGKHLIPNTTLNAEVIYGEKRLYELVFNAGV